MAHNILALDIGDKRIGAAIADIAAPFPAPLMTLETSQNLLEEFAQLVKRHRVVAVVIGLPRNQSGERTQQTERVERIAKLLRIPNDISVYWQDESLTSVKAEEELKRRKKPYAKSDIDALAATYILNDFIKTDNMKLVQAPRAALAGAHRASPKKPVHAAASVASAKRRHTSLFRKAIMAALALLAVVLLSAAGLFGWYTNALRAPSNDENYKVISIAQGSSTAAIAQSLQQEGLIKSARAFVWYVRINGLTNLQAGDYRISSNDSVQEIAAALSGGAVATEKLTILPGQRIDEVFATLQTHGFSESELQNALTAVRDHRLLKDVPPTMRLEGYLFPDTYELNPSMGAEAVLRRMLDNFEQKIAADPSIAAGLTRQNMSFADAVIVASVVQKEVREYEDQQKVAQVFLRRLAEGMPLGADPTFRYAAAMEGGPINPSNTSRYNTRLHAGLPPSAIGNFNISALKAVANPSPATYLYFVAGDDGVTHFSYTLEEHQSLTRRYCTTLCQ